MSRLAVLGCLLLAGCAGWAPEAASPPAPRRAAPQPRLPNPEPDMPPLQHAVHAVAPNQVELAYEFVDLLLKEQFDAAAARFDPTMQALLPPARLAAAWHAVLRRAGPLRAVRWTETRGRPPRTYSFFECQLERQSWSIEVVVDAAGRISGLGLVPHPPPWEPPEYVDQSSFAEREVAIGAPPLRGVLSVPNEMLVGAVVLVHGSGPQDEDASTGPNGTGNKIFKDLAWGLASSRIAVLRYAKRTWAYPDQFENRAYTLDDEVVNDACLALEQSSHELGLPPSTVFVVAHSLGAALAPRIASSCVQPPAGFVLLAGPTRRLPQLLFDQFRFLLQLAGKDRNDVASELEELSAGFLLASIPGATASEIVSFSGMRAPRSYWADVSTYDPALALTRAPRTPMLVLQGGRDYQVTLQDFDGWRDLLHGHPDATLRLYPALDHRFLAGEGPSTPLDYQRSGHVSHAVVTDIARWVQQRSRASPGRTGRTVPPPHSVVK